MRVARSDRGRAILLPGRSVEPPTLTRLFRRCSQVPQRYRASSASRYGPGPQQSLPYALARWLYPPEACRRSGARRRCKTDLVSTLRRTARRGVSFCRWLSPSLSRANPTLTGQPITAQRAEMNARNSALTARLSAARGSRNHSAALATRLRECARRGSYRATFALPAFIRVGRSIEVKEKVYAPYHP